MALLVLLPIFFWIQAIKSAHFQPKRIHHLASSGSVSLQNLSYFQNLWLSSDCDAFQTANETFTQIWSSTMAEMAYSASEFFSLGNYSLSYKIEYLFEFNPSSVFDISILDLDSWTPYFFFSIIAFLTLLFLVFACQAFCIKKYRPFARCCLIDLNNNSGSTSEKCGLFSCISISGLLMLFAILLMILNNDIFLGFGDFKCFVINTAIEVYEPLSTDDQWLGTFSAIQKLSNASGILKELSTDSGFNYSELNTSYLNNSYYKILAEFESNLSVYDNRTLYNPNPLTNQATPNISSTFLSNWGPSKSSGTYLYYLRLELATREMFISLLSSALADSFTIVNRSLEFATDLIAREADFSEFGDLFGQGFADLETFLSGEDSTVEKFFTAMLLVFCLNLLPMILGFLGFILVAFCRCKFCNFCLHTSWIMNCVMFSLTIIILLFGFFYSGLLVWGCEIYTNSFEDPEVFATVSQKLGMNETLTQTLNFCIFNETHNLVEFFPFGQVLSLSDHLFESVSNLSNLSLSTKYIDADISLLEEYYIDYETMAGKYTESNENHPIAVMETLNLWSDYETEGSYQTTYGKCEITCDEYVFQEEQCLYDEKYESGDDVNEDFGQTICISLEETAENFATLRYPDSAFSSCNNNITSFKTVQEAIIEYYVNLYVYKEDTQALAQEMLESLLSYQEKLEYIDSELNSLYNSTKLDFEAFTPLFEVTSDPRNKSLSTSLNCSFLREGFFKMGNSVCVTTLDGIFYLYITMMFMLVLQLVLIIMSCLASIRMLPRDFDSEGQVLMQQKDTGGVQLRRHAILY